MPHLLLASAPNLTFPFQKEGFVFMDLFVQDEANSLILACFENKKFFLLLQKKQKGYLLKYDKRTRISPVGILKKALGILKEEILKQDSTLVLYDNLSQNSPRQNQKSPYLLSPDELCTLIRHYPYQIPKPEQHIDTPTPLFHSCKLEIGFGSGRRILEQAKQEQETLFIGIEIHTPSIEQVLRQISLQKLHNLVILCCDARILLEGLNSNCLSEIAVHFPIPWKKHHRRIFTPNFITQAKRVLKQGGQLHLRSDDEEYTMSALGLILQESSSHCEIFKNASASITSKYEARWLRQNRNIYDIFWKIEHKEPLEMQEETFEFSNSQKAQMHSFFKECPNAPIRFLEEDILLSIKNISHSKNGNLLLSLCLGALAYPQNTYLLLSPAEALYCPNLLPTEANFKAHQKLKQLDKEIV